MTPEEQADALRAAIDQENMGVLVVLSKDPVIAGAVRLINHYGLWSDPVLSPEEALEMARLVLEAKAAVE